MQVSLGAELRNKRHKRKQHHTKQQQKSYRQQHEQETGNKKLKKSNWIIELDPGHGGNDSGAVGKTNDQPQEKDINLKIAKYIKQELSKNSNIKVYLTRTGDTKPELSRASTESCSG